MLKTIIVDDEESGANVLKLLIENYFAGLAVKEICHSIYSAEEAIQKHSPDLVFLDIQMPGGGGFELLKKIKSYNFAVVFVTAHEQYALRALKLSAVDYLLKPVNRNDLEEAIEKSVEWLNLKRNRTGGWVNALLNNASPKSEDKILVINKYKGEEIAFSKIVYINADSNYSVIHTSSGTNMIASKTLKEMEDLVDDGAGQFLRIHKSFMINLSYFKTTRQSDGVVYVCLKDGTELEVSKRRWAEHRSFLQSKAVR